ncbi:MAG: hypothetical protein IK104_04630 [Clostridia bacterium]|nr:hypothetical protein [Clostridia bacterium]
MFLFFPMELKIFLYILLAAAVAVGVVFLVRWLRRRSVKGFAQGIADNIESFYGMFESLETVAEGKTDKQKETIALWDKTIHASENNESGYKELYDKRFGDYVRWDKDEDWRYRDVAKTLVRAAAQAGVKRSADVFVEGNEQTAERYVLPGDGVIYYDKKYQVLAPCWIFNDEVVDKGVIR